MVCCLFAIPLAQLARSYALWNSNNRWERRKAVTHVLTYGVSASPSFRLPINTSRSIFIKHPSSYGYSRSKERWLTWRKVNFLRHNLGASRSTKVCTPKNKNANGFAPERAVCTLIETCRTHPVELLYRKKRVVYICTRPSSLKLGPVGEDANL